jgi:hypothetical protein
MVSRELEEEIGEDRKEREDESKMKGVVLPAHHTLPKAFM